MCKGVNYQNVVLYLKINSIRKVSELLNCKKSTLHRWIQRYFETFISKKLTFFRYKSLLY